MTRLEYLIGSVFVLTVFVVWYLSGRAVHVDASLKQNINTGKTVVLRNGERQVVEFDDVKIPDKDFKVTAHGCVDISIVLMPILHGTEVPILDPKTGALLKAARIQKYLTTGSNHCAEKVPAEDWDLKFYDAAGVRIGLDVLRLAALEPGEKFSHWWLVPQHILDQSEPVSAKVAAR